MSYKNVEKISLNSDLKKIGVQLTPSDTSLQVSGAFASKTPCLLSPLDLVHIWVSLQI